MPVSMCQYGTGQRASSRSVQPLSGSAYRSRYASRLAVRHHDQRRGAMPVEPPSPVAAGRRGGRPERSRSAGLVSTRNPQPCEKPADGACTRVPEQPVDDIGRHRPVRVVVAHHPPAADHVGELHGRLTAADGHGRMPQLAVPGLARARS